MSDLGTARGRITIDTSGVRTAQKEVQQASQAMNQALGAVGISLGAAGAVQLARFALEAVNVATAYRRQEVAALSLAGSQKQLNQLLDTYRAATGGAIDDAQALADVTRLQAVGFADSAEELDRFARAARGIAIATGQSQDYVISQLQLAIANQSTLRLDQLGLGVSEVKKRIDELRAANKNLTEEMAYQQAILEAANKKFGELADSAAGQKTEVEKLETSWKNLRLELGNTIEGNVNEVSSGINFILDALRQRIKETNEAIDRYEAAARAPFASRTSIGRVTPTRIDTGAPLIDQQKLLDAQLDYSRDLFEINRDAAQAIQDATEQYGRQRAETIRQYELGIVREAEDFARMRARQQRDYERSILQLVRDSREREAEWAADLGDRTAEIRKRSNERVAELEADFARQRERAQRNFARQLRDAAAQLDAVRVRDLQREFREGQQEAQEDHKERLDKERRAHEESISQANKAYQERLADARRADERRLEDMRLALAQQRADEDEDRAIRRSRAEADHQAALAQQATEHARNLARIGREAQEQRDALAQAFRDQLADLGLHNVAYRAEQLRAQKQALEDVEPFMRAWFNTAIQAMNATLPFAGHPSNADPYIDRIAPSTLSRGSIAPSGSRTINIAPGAVNVVAPADMALDQRTAAWFMGLLHDFFEGYPQ